MDFDQRLMLACLLACISVKHVYSADHLNSSIYKFDCSGTTISQSSMVNYAFSYTIYEPETILSYDTLSSMDAIDKLKKGEIDCAMIEHHIDDDDEITQIVNYMVPISIIYSPPRKMSDGKPVSMVLNLTIEDIADIILNNIKSWNYFLPEYDPEGLEDPDIRLILRTDACSENYYLTSALAKVDAWSKKYGKEPMYQFPDDIFVKGVIKTAYYNGIDSTVLTIPGSLSYTSFAVTLELRDDISFANLRGGASSEYIDGRTPNFQGLMQNTSYEFFEKFRDYSLYPLAGTWPIGGPIYAVFSNKNDPLNSCYARRKLMLFWSWMLSEAKTRSYLDLLGITKLSDDINDAAVKMIRDVRCLNGFPAANLIARPQHTPKAAFAAALATVLVLGAASMGIVIAYVVKEFRSIPVPATIFIIFLLLGACSNFFSLGFYYEIPRHNFTCLARNWTSRLGLSFMFTAIFVRAFQIRAIHAIGRKSRILTTKKNKAKGIVSMALSFSVLIGLEILILILWSAIDPTQSKVSKLNEIQRTFEYKCGSNLQTTWSLINLGYLTILLCFGLYVVYNTWEMKYLVLESKWMAICIYNAAFILLLVATIQLSISDIGDDGTFWAEGLGIGVTTILTLVVLYLPKLFKSKLTNRDSENEEGSFNSASGV